MLAADLGSRQPSLLLLDHADDLLLGETTLPHHLLLRVGQTLHQIEGASGGQVSARSLTCAQDWHNPPETLRGAARLPPTDQAGTGGQTMVHKPLIGRGRQRRRFNASGLGQGLD